MPSDDELRRVAEDVRALARSLARDFRSAVDRVQDGTEGPGGGDGPAAGSGSRSRERRSAREDFADAGRVARQEFRRVQRALHRSTQYHYPYPPAGGDEGADDTGSAVAADIEPGPGCGPRCDNWGGRPRDRMGARPGDWGGPGWTGRGRALGPPSSVAVRERAPKPARAPKPVPVPRPPLRHRHDGSTLIGLLAVVFGLAWLTAITGVANVSAVTVVAVALMVVGVAMVVTARTDWALSRRAWPILGGGMLAATLLAFSISPNLPVGFQHLSVGSRTITPATWAAVPATVHGGFGRTAIDLTGLSDPPPQAKTLAVDNAAGQLEIMLPANLTVVLHATVSAGLININGQFASGVSRSVDQTLNSGTAGPALTLTVQSGFGDTEITQLPYGAKPSGSISVKPSIPTPPTPGTP